MEGNLNHVVGLGILVPVVAIIMGVGAGIVAMIVDYRRKREMYELHHKERLMAIERGMEVPPLPPEFFENRGAGRNGCGRNSLRRGLVWLFVGLGLFIALYVNHGLESAAWALIPIGMGIANLIHNSLAPRLPPTDTPPRRP
jgi:Domain of unknown function (DUF6249)